MGIFKAINEGRYAARVTQIVAAKMRIPVSILPQWVKDSIFDNAKLYKEMGFPENDIADIVIKGLGEEIIKEITNKK